MTLGACLGRGMSCINRLISMGETPFVKCLIGDGLPLYSVYASLPERKLASHFLLTVSKTLLMSIAANNDLCAGFLWLKPSVMFCVRLVSSVLVEWCGLKPCCVGNRGMYALVLFRTCLSSICDVLQRRDIGR